MLSLMILVGLGLWVLFAIGTVYFGRKLGLKYYKTARAGKLGAFLGFMLTMGGFIVYWTVEYIVIQQRVNHLYIPHPKWIREYGYKDTTDAYVHKNVAGKIDTFIQCHNIDVPLARNCYQDFLLDSALKVKVIAKFQRVHLQDWQLIQQQAKTLLNRFFIQPQNVKK